MKTQLENIKAKAYLIELEKEAKTIPRKDLEDLYITAKIDTEERVGPGWTVYAAIITIVSLILFGVMMSSDEVKGGEYQNVKILSKEICNQEKTTLRYFKSYDYGIQITCEEADIIVMREP